MNLAQQFHPAVEQWFIGHFVQPTPVQAQAWPPIKAGRHSLEVLQTDAQSANRLPSRPQTPIPETDQVHIADLRERSRGSLQYKNREQPCSTGLCRARCDDMGFVLDIENRVF